MKSRIVNISMSENIIDFVCDYIKGSGKKTAFISGGKRQFLFIKKKLAVMKDRSFTSPSFFTNDDFIENAIFENTKLVKIPDIEAAFIIYEIIRLEASELLKGKKSFSEFLQWAIEIVSFINQLDLENVSQDMLKNVKANADIGYDVPESINNLLKNIFRIRTLFHASLEKASKTAKGLSFLKVSEFDSEKIIGDFEEIILAAPFYLHKTEIQIYKKIFDSEKLTIIVQGNPLEYSSLRKIYDAFGVPLPPYAEKNRDMSLNIYCAYDDQSQSTLLKNLISRLPEKEHDKTAVILPETKLLQSVVSEISVITDNYNVSAGYPAAKTAVFTLLKSIIDAQISRRGKNYYVKDLIKVFSNPLVKNMRFFGDASLSRIIAHKLEQSFDKNSKNHLAGKVFVSFDEIVSAKNVLKEISKSSAGASGYINPEKLKGILTDIFNTLFTVWEKPQTLADFAAEMQLFTEKLCNLSIVSSYPLNSPAIEIILSLCAQMKYGRVSQVKFAQSDILNIFGDLIKNERISLLGSPLKGLQILGLLESRNLSFENIFIIGMTDSAIPAVKKDSPLIPKDIMFALGIEMAKKDYEIQNYHFNRLTSAAKNINLIYPDNEKEERSRFIERLIWDKQLKNKDLDTVKTKGFIIPVFIGINKEKKKYEKTDKIKQYLKKIKYSYSKIDTYLRCRLEFYFKYVLGLDKAAEIGEEAAESEMGSFVHKFLQTVFYEGMESSKLKEKDFEKHFHEELDRLFENSFELKFREDAFLIKKVLDYRMAELLNFESAREYDGICFCEKKYETVLQSANNTYDIECVIDRIDKKGTDYVILDYKTGKTDAPLISSNFNKLVADGLTRKNIKKAVKSLQLPLYKYVFERCEKAKAAECGIYDIKKSEIFNFFSNAKNAEETYNSCIKIIETILDEISAGEYFEFDKDDGVNCERCKFFYICRTQ